LVCSLLNLSGGKDADDTLVPISDTDQLRETCAGMFGGDEAFIEGMSETRSPERGDDEQGCEGRR
jgi:hypothetical protein